MKIQTLIITSAVALVSSNAFAGTDTLMNMIEPESADIFIGNTGTDYNTQYTASTNTYDAGWELNSEELFGSDIVPSSSLTMASINATLENNPTAAGGGSVTFDDAGYTLNSDEGFVD